MKKRLSIALVVFSLCITAPAMAQDGTVKEIGKDIKRGTKKATDKTANLASKGKAKATDALHKDKEGPDGQKIYIDNHARYYWVDDTGHRQYVTEVQLKDKPKN